MTQRTILRAGELQAAIKASNRIQLGIAFWLAIMVASIFAIINPATRSDGLVFPGSVMAFIVSVSSILLSALRVRNLQSLSATPPPRDDPPGDDVSDMLTYEQRQRMNAEIAARTQQMESIYGSNQMRLGKIVLDSGTWGDLANVLRQHEWRWTRDIVARAEVFRSLSGRFADITAEMINIDFVEGPERKRVVTMKGRHWLVERSPNLFDEHVRT